MHYFSGLNEIPIYFELRVLLINFIVMSEQVDGFL